jgi:hypothetical protein
MSYKVYQINTCPHETVKWEVDCHLKYLKWHQLWQLHGRGYINKKVEFYRHFKNCLNALCS